MILADNRPPSSSKTQPRRPGFRTFAVSTAFPPFLLARLRIRRNLDDPTSLSRRRRRHLVSRSPLPVMATSRPARGKVAKRAR